MKPVLFSISAAAVVVDRVRRSMSGTLVRAGEVGQTDFGPLRVPDPTLLEWPEDLTRVDLTREHELDVVRGHIAAADVTAERIYVVAKAAEGPLGDAALGDAMSRTRGGFSFRVERPVVRPGADGIPDLIGGLVTSVGQVESPAYNSARIDAIAASKTPRNEPGTTGGTMTEEQIARLAELRAKQTLTAEERAELEQLVVLEHTAQAAEAAEEPPAEEQPPAAPVSASVPAVPGGVPRPQAAPRPVIRERGTALQRLVTQVTRALAGQIDAGQSALPAISAAFSDVISTGNTANIEPVAWSDELWSGLEYQPVFSDLLTPDKLDHWSGNGWRFVTSPGLQDYAGDKAAVPSGVVKTEAASYTAARQAVGVDIDRKFYDFPNEGFVTGLLQRIRETWEINMDDKSRAYVVSAAQPAGRAVTVTLDSDTTIVAPVGTFAAGDVGKVIVGPGIPEGTTITTFTSSSAVTLSAAATATGTVTASVAYAASTTILKAAARIAQALKNTRVGRNPWIMLNDEDMFKLLDLTEQNLPVLLELWGIKPEDFRSSPSVTAGTVLGGVKQAAKLRTLPGSPIRVSAQHLANGGIDEAFFGYWAIEEHHPRGILSMAHTQ